MISELSQTAASNYPAGSDSPATLDDTMRAVSSFVATLRDGKGFTNPIVLASGTTTDIGGQNSQFVEISGTTTITSFGSTYNGPRYLRFQGSLTLTHNSTTLNIPIGVNIKTYTGYTCLAVPNQSLSGWNIYSMGGGSEVAGFRNRIINGGMVIDQRNAGASVTLPSTGGQYTLDRWAADSSSASKYSIQQNAGSVTPPAGFTNYLGVTSLAATSVASGDYYYLGQSIEGYNVADFGFGTANAKTVTLSFWVRSSLTGTFGGSLQAAGSARTYPFSYAISSANTWTQISVTVAGDTTGTWLTNNGVGLRVFFGLGIGSNYSGTAGVWSATNYVSATGATSVVGTNGATFYITGVQLELGVTASVFEQRPYGTELALCQRYYQVTYGGYGGSSLNAVNNSCAIAFTVNPRATPTVTFISPQVVVNFPTSAPIIANIQGYGFRALRTANATAQDSLFMDLYTVSAEL